jgi:nucleotide-binding universal stress UspA family protein
MSERTASPHFRCVVAAIDFSPESDRALAWATHLASRRDAALLLVHAVTWPEASDALVGGDEMLRELVAGAQHRLDELKISLLGQVREVSCVVADGFAPRVILESAATHRADLIVIGTRGLRGWKHALLGSTAQRVIAKSNCPVLAVHSSDPLPSERSWSVLAAIDGSNAALASVQAGLRVVGADAKEVVLLRVVEPPTAAYPATAELFTYRWIAESRRVAEENLASAARALAATGVDVATRLCDGFPPDVIVGEASRSDLVVMGTRGGGLGHLFLGSTAERVVQRATVPVLVVPHECAAIEGGEPIVGAVVDEQC